MSEHQNSPDSDAKANAIAMLALPEKSTKSISQTTTENSSGETYSFILQLPEKIQRIPRSQLKDWLSILVIKQAFNLSDEEAKKEIQQSKWHWENFTGPNQKDIEAGRWLVKIDKQSYDEALARLYGTSTQSTENSFASPSGRIERFQNSARNLDTILQRRILLAYVNRIYSTTHPQNPVTPESVLYNDPAWVAILDRLLRQQEQLHGLRDDIKQVLGGSEIFESFPQHYQELVSIARKLSQLSPEQIRTLKPLSFLRITNSAALDAYEQYVEDFRRNSSISTGFRHQAPHTETNATPINSQPATPVERFKQRLKQKAIAQLEENRTLIQQAQEKYQNPANTEALGRLRQVVEADERLESTQKRLKNRQRTNPEFWRDETGAPVVTTKLNSEQRQALLDQNQAKLDEIFQVRRTLLQLYPASGLLNVGDVKETNNDAQLLATLNKRFESIFSDIEIAKTGVISEDIPLSQLEPLVAATLKETSPSDIAAVTEYLKGDRNRENTFRFLGFLGQIALTVAAIFTGGFAGAVMGAIAAAMGIGQAVYEFEQADDLNTVAKTGEAGGNQLLSDPDAAQFNYVMGWVNLVLAGIDVAGLAVVGASALGKGLRGAERIVNLPGGEVLARVTPAQIRNLERSRLLQQAGKIDEAEQILAQLKQELGQETYDQLQKVWDSASVNAKKVPNATNIEQLRQQIPERIGLVEFSQLENGQVRVSYTTDVKIEYAPNASLDDIKLHVPTALDLLEIKDNENLARRLLNKLNEWLGRPGANAYPKAFEAQKEIEKHINLIYARAQRLASVPPNSNEAEGLLSEIGDYQEQIAHWQDVLANEVNGSLGVGYVAERKPGYELINPEAIEAGYPPPPKGFYYYRLPESQANATGLQYQLAKRKKTSSEITVNYRVFRNEDGTIELREVDSNRVAQNRRDSAAQRSNQSVSTELQQAIDIRAQQVGWTDADIGRIKDYAGVIDKLYQRKPFDMQELLKPLDKPNFSDAKFKQFRQGLRDKIVNDIFQEQKDTATQLDLFREYRELIPDSASKGELFRNFARRSLTEHQSAFIDRIEGVSVEIKNTTKTSADDAIFVKQELSEAAPPPGKNYLVEYKSGEQAFKSAQAKRYSQILSNGQIITKDNKSYEGFAYIFDNEEYARKAMGVIKDLNKQIYVGYYDEEGALKWLPRQTGR